ncbi:MAG: peptide chain release factor N(5)-glutamine methyltransferase [Bacteroidaceae bacterium]|nr:peptide chain release factor N(5)-glutamine methyltransferase [Bacteroidaceae bacterium]
MELYRYLFSRLSGTPVQGDSDTTAAPATAATVGGADSVRGLIQWVMEETFGWSLTQVLLCKDSDLSADEREKLENIIQQLQLGVPVQYAVGHTTFCGHRFAVRPGVLIPRPETAELVEWVGEGTGTLLDIGTGSGCIAVSLALMGWQATAFDVSPEALVVARENAAALHAAVQFEACDILHPAPTDRRWDAIVSNPPYVCHSEAATMEDHVLHHEPHLALFVPDDDPLLFYRAIAAFAREHLTTGGRLFFEINRNFPDETAHLLQSFGFQNIEIRADQFGNARMIRCQKD